MYVSSSSLDYKLHINIVVAFRSHYASTHVTKPRFLKQLLSRWCLIKKKPGLLFTHFIKQCNCLLDEIASRARINIKHIICIKVNACPREPYIPVRLRIYCGIACSWSWARNLYDSLELTQCYLFIKRIARKMMKYVIFRTIYNRNSSKKTIRGWRHANSLERTAINFLFWRQKLPDTYIWDQETYNISRVDTWIMELKNN